jgi:hypothetical protein
MVSSFDFHLWLAHYNLRRVHESLRSPPPVAGKVD